MAAQEKEVQRLEAGLIKDKSVKEDSYTVKAQYCEHLLKYGLRDTASVLEYCKAARNYLKTRMEYFRELMSTQEDNARAQCFSLYRTSRNEYSAMNDVALGHLPPDELESGDDKRGK